MHLLLAPILLGLGAIAIPVIIHLLHRQKTTPIAWGAMQFLIPSKLQAKRRKKVEHWLLMLLRIAAIAFLVFLLARPIWQANAFNALAGDSATDFAVVVDHSLSTGRRGSGAEAGNPQTILDRTVASLNEIAGKLRPADTLTVVLAEHKPRTLTDHPVSGSSADLVKLRDSLAQLKPGLVDADIPAAVQMAREVASHGRNLGKRIVVLSDEQRSGWQVENTAAWKSAIGGSGEGQQKPAAIFEVPFAPDAAVSNVAVTRLDVRPAVIGPGRPIEITATLTNTGGGALAHLPVNLVVDGKPAGALIIDDLPGGSSRTIRFVQTFTEAGSHWAKVSVDLIDALEADNSAVVSINVLAKLPVLVIDHQLTSAGSFRASQFLAAAMEPVDMASGEQALIQVKIVGASDAPLANFNDYAAVVVNDIPQLPAETLGRLADYARAGHGVWVLLGPNSDAKTSAARLAASGLFAAEISGPAKAGGKETAPPAVAVNDPANPMVSLLATADRNGMAAVTTTGWWSIKPTEADERVILATTTGDPLVIDRQLGNRGGRVVLWATGADGVWNNWPLSPSFVPLVQETVLYLAGSGVGARSGSIDAGKPLLWTGPPLPPVIAATITRPDGAPAAPLRLSLESGRFATRYDDTFVPGLYEMRFSPSGIPQPVYFAVGIDPRELDPATLTESDIRSLNESGVLAARVLPEKIATIFNPADGGAELWPYLAIAVLGILVLETGMTYRMVRFQVSERKMTG